MSKPDAAPVISVVITTEHEEESLVALIRAVATQAEHDMPVEIIVTDYSPDGRQDAVTGLARTEGLPVRYYRVAGATAFEARNVGLRQSRGEVIVFTDDDCLPDPGWLAGYRRAFNDNKVGMAGGPDKAPANVKAFLRALDYVLTSFAGTANMRSAKRPGSAFYPRSWNMAVCRKVIEFAGIFDESLPGAQELELSHRIQAVGFEVIHLPNCMVQHRRDTNIAGLFLSGYRSSAGRACLSRREPGSGSFLHALPALGVVSWVGMLAISAFNPTALKLPAGIFAAYLGWLLASGCHAAFALHSARMLALVPAALAVQHVSHAMGFVAGFVAPCARSPRMGSIND